MNYEVSAADPYLAPWVRAPFVAKEIEFFSLGQAVAYFKAMYFGDASAAAEILLADNPRICRSIDCRIGRSDDVGWVEVLRKVLWLCTKERTLQNPRQVAALVLTQGRPITFCVANELLWGAGVLPGESVLGQVDRLPGKNWFGKALTHVRDTLLEPLFPLADGSADRPASNRERAVLLALTLYYLDKAAGIWGRKFKVGDIAVGLRGRAAGKACYPSLDIKYNERLFLENSQAFVDDTVPHEVAHIIVFQLFGPQVAGHGKEWKDVMKALGKAPSTYHSFSTINTGIHVGKRIVSSCGHRIFLLSPSQTESARFCNECKRSLRILWPEQYLRAAINDLRGQFQSEHD